MKHFGMEQSLKEIVIDFWEDTQAWKHSLDHVITKSSSSGPEDSAWDSYSPPKSLYVFTSIYVLLTLFMGPPILRYRPAFPLHIAFFAFNLVSLVVNFCLFMNTIVLFYSKNSVPVRLLSFAFDQEGVAMINFTWINCAVKIFEFLGEALKILHGKHDNFRTLRITYFLIHLLNMYIGLRFGFHKFLSLATIGSAIFETVVFVYTNFEPSMHIACPKMQAKMERIICTLEILQFANIIGNILPHTATGDMEYSRLFRLWICAFCGLSISMLSVIFWKADLNIRDRETQMIQNETVSFSDYGYKPTRPVGVKEKKKGDKKDESKNNEGRQNQGRKQIFCLLL